MNADVIVCAADCKKTTTSDVSMRFMDVKTPPSAGCNPRVASNKQEQV